MDYNMESVNHIPAGTDIYIEGEKLDSVALLLNGKVNMHVEGLNTVTSAGSFLGLCDANSGIHSVTYTAEKDCDIYPFSFESLQQSIRHIMSINMDYGALMVIYLSNIIAEASKAFQAMDTIAAKGYDSIKNLYDEYKNLAMSAGINVEQIKSIDKLKESADAADVDFDKIIYYRACSQVATDIQKAFYSADSRVCIYHINDQVNIFEKLLKQCAEKAGYLMFLLNPLINGRDNLFDTVSHLSSAIYRVDGDTKPVADIFDECISLVNDIDNVLNDSAGVNAAIDRNHMEEQYSNIISGASFGLVETMDADIALVEQPLIDFSELDDSLEIILEYSEIEDTKGEEFIGYISKFKGMTDKTSTDDGARALRRNISKIYYDLYIKVFKKSLKDEEPPLPVRLFLKTGFLDERLLDENQLEELISIDGFLSESIEGINIYTMYEWLIQIYKGKKKPSKNEFDLDFEEYLRDAVKNSQLTKEQVAKIAVDSNARLEFEVKNMFKSNHRLVNGQPATFVPFLYSEDCGSSLMKTYLFSDRIAGAVKEVRNRDFGAFYREMLCDTDVEDLKKEYIQKEIIPDIILLPTFGNRTIMWQELSGRKRNTAGRFILPMFYEGDLLSTFIHLTGEFRWEICRTMQGVHWNDIQIKSLTSEYADLIQFYKKNKDLSEDRKEKLKALIQKCRGNTREIFTSEYMLWMTREYGGNLVLSEPVREIMSTYCPFRAKLRSKIETQPMFNKAMARYNREITKKKKEYMMKTKKWKKEGILVPKTIEDTIEYYNN